MKVTIVNIKDCLFDTKSNGSLFLNANNQVPPVFCGRHFHDKLSNRKLDEMRTHQTDASLFLELQIRKI